MIIYNNVKKKKKKNLNTDSLIINEYYHVLQLTDPKGVGAF